MPYVLLPSEITVGEQVGPKTKNLKTLLEMGLLVPNFVAVSAHEINKFKNNFQGLSQAILQKFFRNAYAVRSSALAEDAQSESFAGQFTTKLNITPPELDKAIGETITQAREFFKGDLSKFSLIIQEFIEPDYAGIIFTRNPLGGREMVVEYYSGRGEEIVGGKVKPERLQFYWNAQLTDNSLPALSVAIEQAKKIEQHFQLPQDIEWCVKEGKWYWLQTRPITSLNKIQHQHSLYLDQVLPQDKEFLYQKTELSEIAPSPTPLTLSLLRKIYSADGPVRKVYKKYGIRYEERDFLKIIGKELFVDREEELKTLLPAYSYLSSRNNQPQLAELNGIGRTMKNMWKLTKISGQKSIDRIFQNLKSALEKNEDESDISSYLEKLLDEYRIIFEINLLAGKALQSLSRAIKSETVSIASVLSCGLIPPDDYRLKIIKKWHGNSLEISDESVFVGHQESTKSNHEMQKWWEELSINKKNRFKSILYEAVVYNRFREYGRWLTVKKIQGLRRLVLSKARELQFKEVKNSYFATLEELVSGSAAEKECIVRKKKYDEYARFNFSSVISSFVSKISFDRPQGVSPGIAKGILVTREMVDRGDYNDQPKILYTPILSPDLTQYFDQIVGIVSESGGILSHLAIVAREKKIPALVNIKLNKDDIVLNKKIEIDGGRGIILRKR